MATENVSVKIGKRTVTKQLPAEWNDDQRRAAFRDVMKGAGWNDTSKQQVITQAAPAPPTNEEYWRGRLSGQGTLQAPQKTLGGMLQGAITDGIASLGASDRYANHLGNKAFGAFNDLTPVGNFTGAEQGGREFLNGISKGDLAQAALGAGVFGASVLPGALGTGARKGVRSFGELLSDEVGAIRAWHGSPHDFDKFSMDKIGTGEGNQAFGRGGYFAESKGVAGSYVQPRGAEPLDVPPEIRDRLHDELVKDDYLGFDTFGQAIHAIRTSPTDFDKAWEVSDAPAIRSALNAYDDAKWPAGQRPRLYEVEIDADPEDFVSWDDHGNAAESLARQQGKKGVRYLDQGSRGAGAGTSNYVVFDDSIIDILNKF